MNAYSSDPYVRKVYAYFGVTPSDIANLPSTNVAGSVTKGGAVIANGQTVATGAVTAGRQDMPGSTKVTFQGITFFKRPPSVSFQQSALPAFVAMNHGVFQFAIIASCGNVVVAHAVAQPKAAVAPAKAVSQPKPQQHQPAPTQTQKQSQQVTVNNTQTVQSAPQSSPAPTSTSSQPVSLANTGPAGVVGVFVLATAAGVWGYRRLLLRKLQA
jgi:hypothetical protein